MVKICPKSDTLICLFLVLLVSPFTNFVDFIPEIHRQLEIATKGSCTKLKTKQLQILGVD